jgi:predicted transcriptional regulator
MGTTKTLSITLPTEILTRAEELAKKEDRTMNELVREALRQYDRQRWWQEITAYGRQQAELQGITSEEDVVRLIHEDRRQRRLQSQK